MLTFLLIPIVAFLVLGFLSSVRILQEYERGVVFRFGRLAETKGPGLVFILPFGIDQLVKVSSRLITTDVPPQDVVTKDNVSIVVNAVILFRVDNPVKAVNNVESYIDSTYQYAQTTLRSVLGSVELDELLSQRDVLNTKIKEILDKHTEPWGVQVTAVEIKQVDLPKEMQRAMAQQAEAERQRRAKVINAMGEAQSSEKLVEAANKMIHSPQALHLRYLQTLQEIATEKNSTIIFPLPMEFLDAFILRAKGQSEPKTQATSIAQDQK